MSERQNAGLVRGLGVWDASALVVGCVIGAGIFRLSDTVAQRAPTPGLFLAAWLIGGLLSLCGALCYAELATRFPKTGGDYVFLTQAYGRFWGFVFGWTKLFVERTGTVAILAFVFARHMEVVLGLPENSAVKPAATAAIVLLTAANVMGLRFGKGIQNLFALLKVGAIVLIIAAGLLAGKGSVDNFRAAESAGSFFSTASALGLALIPVLWAFGGWTEAAYVAEEVRDPRRDLPRAIIGGLAGVTVLYLVINAVYLYYMPLPELRNTDLVAAGTMDKIWAGVGGRVVAAMVMASTFGALNGYILTGGRILFALGRDHALFARMGKVSEGSHTPAPALACMGALSVLLVWTGTLDQLVTYSSVVVFVFFALSGLSVFVFRRRAGAPEASYKVWGYPVTPALFVGLCLAFAGNAAWGETRETLLGFAVASLGAPLYLLSRRLSGPRGPS
jgi:basic amino acid/polyamine antiporter, APA family